MDQNNLQPMGQEAPVQTPYQPSEDSRQPQSFYPPEYTQPAQPPVQQIVAEPVAEEVAQEPLQPAAPKEEKRAKKKSGKKAWKGILCAVLTVVLVCGSCFATAFVMEKRFSATQIELSLQIADLEQRLEAEENRLHTVTVPGGTQGSVVTVPTGDIMTPAQVYQQNLASVVLVQNVISNGYYTSGGTGSGFIISTDGYVVTNYHVVEGGGKLSVITYDDNKYEAKLIGYDNANDVALLKIEGEGFQAAVIGDSDALIVGDQVAAIGNPLGELTSTMTVGYVSAKERDVNTSGFAINMIQTDAAINSGNSGGPLFNMYGHVVGITSAKYSGSSSSGASIEGIGFAIPINDVMPLIDDLMTNGFETGPYLGINISDMNAEGAEYYGLPMGAYVSVVYEGYCAEKAGIQAKDIIISLGGQKVEGVNDLSKALRGYKAGDTVEIVVSRSGKEMTFNVTLDQKPQESELIPQGQQSQQQPSDSEGSQGIWPFFPGWG